MKRVKIDASNAIPTRNMQTCLNDDCHHMKSLFKDYPILWPLAIVVLILTVVFTVIGLYCIDTWTCPSAIGPVFSAIGVTLIIFIVCFIILPYFIRSALNCCFPHTDESNNYVSNPLSSAPVRSRSRSRSPANLV